MKVLLRRYSSLGSPRAQPKKRCIQYLSTRITISVVLPVNNEDLHYWWPAVSNNGLRSRSSPCVYISTLRRFGVEMIWQVFHVTFSFSQITEFSRNRQWNRVSFNFDFTFIRQLYSLSQNNVVCAWINAMSFLHLKLWHILLYV